MAFATRLVAIERTLGKYSVHSQFEGGVPLDKSGLGKRLSDVSTDEGYRDFAGVFTLAEVMRCCPSGKTSEWLARLPRHVWIMIVSEEWESGLC
jgi:hypothetical protein